QDQNGKTAPHTVDWMNGTLNSNNSLYFEGMSVPQRVLFVNIAATAGNVHTLTFSHDAGKNSVHAYDFVTSWSQAVASGNGGPLSIPTTDLMGNLTGLCAGVCPPNSNRSNCACGTTISPDTCTCQGLLTGANHVMVAAPDNMGTAIGDDVMARVVAYEGVYGNRLIDMYGSSAITNTSLVINGYSGSAASPVAG